MNLVDATDILIGNQEVNEVRLNNNLIWTRLTTSNLFVQLDASNTASYPGTGTTWTDLQGNDNGTLINGPTFNAANGGSIVTDGVNDYIRVGRVTGTGTSTQSMTYELWINPADNDGNIMSMSQSNPQDGWNMPPIAASGGRFRGKVWANNYIFSNNFTQGTWYQVVLTWNYPSRTQSLYVNGVLNAAQGGITYASSNVDNFLYLGQQNPGADNTGMFGGRYGIFRIYNRALSANEILQNFNANRSRYGI
jgi:hypothetical protein